MHALALVPVQGTDANDCTVDARIRDTVTVQPGGGLADGDPVRLVQTPGFLVLSTGTRAIVCRELDGVAAVVRLFVGEPARTAILADIRRIRAVLGC
jgi:hypothetical protein